MGGNEGAGAVIREGRKMKIDIGSDLAVTLMCFAFVVLIIGMMMVAYR